MKFSSSVSEIKTVVVFWVFLEHPKLEKGLYLHCKLFTVTPVQPNICLCLSSSSEKHLIRSLPSVNGVIHSCCWMRAINSLHDFNSKVKSSLGGSSLVVSRCCEMGSAAAWGAQRLGTGVCGLTFSLLGCPELAQVVPELVSWNEFFFWLSLKVEGVSSTVAFQLLCSSSASASGPS